LTTVGWCLTTRTCPYSSIATSTWRSAPPSRLSNTSISTSTRATTVHRWTLARWTLLHLTALRPLSHSCGMRSRSTKTYMSASEASHRLYGFDLHKEHPNVIRLAVHLKGRQTILFQEGTDAATVLNRNLHITLTAWFAFNKTAREHVNPSAPLRLALNTLYHDFPRIATWKKKEKQWALRTRTPGLLPIGRMYFV